MPKQTHSVRPEQEGRDEALEAYLLEHAPGLREYEAVQHRAFIQIEQDAYERHPDPTAADIGAGTRTASKHDGVDGSRSRRCQDEPV
jgi:hypothetical protein